jgi:hypothetical protein
LCPSQASGHIVELPYGIGDTSVAAAIAAGFIIENSNGVLEYAGNGAAGPAVAAVDTARATEGETAEAAGDRSGESQAPARDVEHRADLLWAAVDRPVV